MPIGQAGEGLAPDYGPIRGFPKWRGAGICRVTRWGCQQESSSLKAKVFLPPRFLSPALCRVSRGRGGGGQ